MDMHHGDMGQIEGVGLGHQLQAQQLLVHHGCDLAVQDGGGIGRQAVDQAIGGLVRAEVAALQGAVVDGAGSGCRRRCAGAGGHQQGGGQGCGKKKAAVALHGEFVVVGLEAMKRGGTAAM